MRRRTAHVTDGGTLNEATAEENNSDRKKTGKRKKKERKTEKREEERRELFGKLASRKISKLLEAKVVAMAKGKKWLHLNRESWELLNAQEIGMS